MIYTTPTQEAYKLAQQDWRNLCNSDADPEAGYYDYIAKHPDVIPEAFRNHLDDEREGRARYQKARDLTYGKERDDVRSGGSIGRLRVLAGGPLQGSTLHFRQVGKLRPLEFDIFSQFADEQMEYIKGVLSVIVPDLCWYIVEYGRYAGLYVHLLHKTGIRVGAGNRIIPDAQLLKQVEYLVKRPPFNFNNSLGYLSVRQAYAGRRVATRHLAVGLDARRVKVSISEIEAILGPCPGSDVTRTLIKDKNPLGDTYPIRPLVAGAA